MLGGDPTGEHDRREERVTPKQPAKKDRKESDEPKVDKETLKDLDPKDKGDVRGGGPGRQSAGVEC